MGETDTEQLIVYTLEFCPNCETLKEYLKGKSVSYRERDMSTAESLTELRVNGVFSSEAPVLQAGSVFLAPKELFHEGRLDEERVGKLIEDV